MSASQQEYCIVTIPQATNGPQPEQPRDNQAHAKQTAQQQRIQTVATAAIFVIAAYIAAQMLADIASLKIGLVAGWAVDMGTFIYPITFTLRDLVHKLLGKRSAQILIITAGVINLFMAGYLMWAASVPSDPSWGLGEAFSAILAPVWRIVLASIVAEIVSELIDTEVYHWFVTKVTRRFQWLRVLLSNSVSVPVDNVIFAVGAFGWLLPWAVVWEIFVLNLIVKYAVTLVSLPFIYLAPDPDWEA
jgi:queuosine precursor transporter